MWAGISQAGKVGLQLLALGVLSRLLPPGDFGLLAMATVVTAFAFMLRDMGTAAAVIQRADLPPRLLDTVFWFNLAIGCGLAAVVAVFSVQAASAFHEPRLAGVLLALAASFPITSSGAVHQALLERRVAFKTLARIELSSAFVALIVAVVAAQQGLGVYALALNQIVTALLTTLQLWFASRWMPSWRFSRSEFRGLWGFSSNLFGSQMLNYFARNADSMLIGRFLGAADLGWYSMAYKIMLFPIYNLASVVARATFPVLSQRQTSLEQVGALYLRSTAAIVLITAPLMAGLWALREPFIEVALGARWLPVAEVLAWLSPVGLLQSILTTVGVIYMTTGRTDIMFRWGVVVLVVTVTAMVIGLRWGYIGVAACYSIANVVLFLPCIWLALRQIKLGLPAMFHALWRQLLAATAMGAVLWGLRLSLLHEAGAIVQLALLIPVGALLYCAIAWFLMPELLRALLDGFRRRNQSTPAPLLVVEPTAANAAPE
jgi:O-antigen/teichoic acid export membrane protein